MKHIKQIHTLVDEVRQRIIETMREKNIAVVQFAPCEEDYEEEHKDDPDALEYCEYRDDHCPYVVWFDKHGSGNDLCVLSVSLSDGEHPFLVLHCEDSPDSYDLYDYDVARVSMPSVYECLEKHLGLEDEPEKVWLVKQESNVDGQILFNVTPCKDRETAEKVVAGEVHTLLTESPAYRGALDYIEGRKEAGDDCPFSWDGKPDGSEGFYIATTCDDYYEQILIEEEEII